MKSLAVIIADHECSSREEIKSILRERADIELLAECSNVTETMQTVQRFRPHLLLMDVQMPDGSGFDVLSKIPAGRHPAVIFVTANDQYALRAFDEHALDYVLKPVHRDRLRNAIEHACSVVKKYSGAALPSCYSLEQLSTLVLAIPRFIIKSNGRFLFLKLDEIDWIQADANYVHLHVGKNVYVHREPIGRMIEHLNSWRFARIHRSIIVNLSKISEVFPCNNGEFIVRLTTGKELSCSRNFRKVIAEMISKPVLSLEQGTLELEDFESIKPTSVYPMSSPAVQGDKFSSFRC